MSASIIMGHRVTFERRRYGHSTYTWAYLHVEGEADSRMLGDPWPAVTWPRKELEKAVASELNHKPI